ncbi:replication initiation protein [Limimaricola hongkongensis]|uniref:Protein involved in initiation of plasmid replication n=1 Tax=Limimaricola hongkongensis DSM 17492 TaxID=1122180 RepID=A0A017H836_9RHOB|nr:replication initiation protein [Limimaricola hongkongensis]EYD70465.1 Protein involved in initiation of plasmid replication [Limimaricola hongkongensis DSM 17492]
MAAEPKRQAQKRGAGEAEAAPERIDAARLSGALRRGTVKKNVAAIHIGGKLTLLQRKLSNVLLLNAYDTLLSQNVHAIDARTLCLMIGYNSNDIDSLRDALRGLAETVAEWDMLDEKGRQEWGVSALLAHARLRDGVCDYAYSPALAEKLHDPRVFALINLDIQRRFTSGHGLALYENCYRFVRTGSTGWWPLEVFRRLMGVDDSAYYRSFKHLNAKVIKPAVEEVNRSSNILIAPEFKRVGRSVTELRFVIRENPQLAMLDIDDGQAVRSQPVYERLRAQGVSDRLARQWIAEHGAEAVAEKLDWVAGKEGVRSPVGYLRAALDAGWEGAPVPPAAPKPAPAPSPAARAAAEARAAKAAEAEAETDLRAARRAARVARFEAVAEAARRRNPTQRDADRRLMLGQLDGELEREDFRRHGWESALNARAIFAFWEEMQPDIFEALPKPVPE